MAENTSRDAFIKSVKEFAASLAKEFGCNEMVVGEDRQKGVWGEEFTAWLESKVGGDCASEIHWYGGERDEDIKADWEKPERNVEFRFRFTSPCVSVRLDHGASFAEIEFSDYKDGEHTGNFSLHEAHSWGPCGGIALLIVLRHKWHRWHCPQKCTELQP